MLEEVWRADDAVRKKEERAQCQRGPINYHPRTAPLRWQQIAMHVIISHRFMVRDDCDWVEGANGTL